MGIAFATALLGAAPAASAASFNWSSASCISAVPCTSVGGITRFAGAVTGANPRDVLLEVVSTTNGASVYSAAVGTTSGTASYIDGRVGTNLTAGAVSQVRFRLRFVTPGTTTDNPLPGPVYFTSLDTDGMQSATAGGYRERFEVITPPTSIVTGPQLEPTSALNAGGTAYSPMICANGTSVGCNDATYGGAGNYVFYPLLSTTPNVAATAVYTGTVGNIDFAFGLEVSPVGPGSVREAFRQYGIAGGVPDSDMVPSPITCTPSPSGVGTSTTCSLTCTNNGPDVAINPSCNFTGTLPAGATQSAGCGTLSGAIASGSTRSCSITFSPLVGGTINLTGGTGALNDTNGGAVQTAGNNPTSGSVVVNGASAADMSAAFSNLPGAFAPGQSYTGLTLTCSNATGGALALAATCAPTASVGTVSNVSCTPAVGGNVAAGGNISCTFDYAMPAGSTQGGNNDPTAAVQFTGTTSATNDTVTTNNTATASVDVVDALDDGLTASYGIGATLNVLNNDTRGATGATVTSGTLTVVTPATAGSTFDPATGAFSVPASAAPGTYTVTYQLCANPATTPAACDTATATIVVSNGADMVPTFGTLPGVVNPGQVLTNLTLTCTNQSPSIAATASICTPSVSAGTVSNVRCTPAVGGTVAAGQAVSCLFDYTAPGTQGGTDEPVTSLVFSGQTGATNDINGGVTSGGNNLTAVNATVIDAVNDVEIRSGGQTGQTTSVATNDQYPTGSTFTKTGGTCPSSSVSSTGVATYDVPVNGSCTVVYQVCAPSPNQTACDNATLTISGSASDMTPTFTGLPSVIRPGQRLTGLTLTCTNGTGLADATATVCQPTASAGTVDSVSCTPAAGSTLAGGSAITCTFAYTAPGTQGGAAELVTAVTFTGQTGADNDVNGGLSAGGNNVTTTTAQVIDAVDDGPVSVSPQGGTVSLLDNDRLNGSAIPAGRYAVTLLDTAALTGVSVDAQGRLVVPANTAPGTYVLTYQLCVNPAVTPAACDTARVTVTVAGQPDLQVSKTHSPATFTERQTGTYTIVARNTGSFATSAAYTVVDTLPAGMTVAAVPTGTGWDCSTTTVGGTTATCTSSTAIASGATAAPITMVVNVLANACQGPDANGVCTVASGTALVNRVAVSGGGEPDTGTVTTNNTATDPTPVRQSGAISGRVWMDANHDRLESAGETGVSGIVVEVLDASGNVAGTANSDSTGGYRIDGLAPGTGYSVRFRDPVSGAYYGRPVSNDPIGGNDPTAATGTGLVSAGVINGVTVPSGNRARINQSLPLDPNGVVYAADNRTPVGGAKVELLDASGTLVSSSCVVGGVNSLVTDSSGSLAGAYSFLVVNPAPAGCPGASTYQLRVTPPAGYVLSTTLPVQAGTLTPPAGCVGGVTNKVCAVQAQNTAPSTGSPTPWYLAMALDPAAGPDVVNNHIPLDSSVQPALLVVKTGDRSQAELGDSVRYTVTIKRTDSGSTTLPALEVIDTLPAGFRYIDGTAQRNGTSVTDPTGKPGPVLRFALGTMAPNSTVTLSYRVRLGVGSMEGTGINTAQATGTAGATCGSTPDALCSNVSQYRVRVTGGVFSTDACVIGKVYVDCNHNHAQDAEELGIPGVRFYLTDGTSVISDVEGKYSLCGLPPRTQVMVVDQTTLPRGSRLTTSSNRNAGDAGSLFLDLKNGEMHRADVIEGSCSNTVLEQVKARRARGETQSLETEKRGGRVLKFDGKPVTAPAQATDSARQRGNAAGQGVPGAVKPRQDGGTPPAAGAATETLDTIQRPVSVNPASSGATSTRASGGQQ